MTAEAYRLGRDVLGPAFGAFARMLLSRAQREKVTRLAFVARDGDFLREVTASFAHCAPLAEVPQLDYVYLSRISTLLPQYPDFAAAVAGEAPTLFGARRLDLATLLRYFRIEPDAVRDSLARHDLSTDTLITSRAALQPLLGDPAFAIAVAGERERQRGQLAAYLTQERLLGNSGTALVDLGWRGSIPAALATTFAASFRDSPLRAWQFAYWDERGPQRVENLAIEGLVSDCRRRRTPREGSAFYAAYILEAVCRAAHGTVLGYRQRADGTIEPLLAGDSFQRDAERSGEAWREPIRRGILEAIENDARRLHSQDERSLRGDAQRLLFRLAFFPSKGEIAAVDGLSHTEGFELHAKPLVDPVRPSPLLSPRRWLAGLASPWRGGYVKATGGSALAAVFAAVEWVLLTFPVVRRIARAAALATAKR